MRLKQKGKTLFMTCEMVTPDGQRDNGFLIGTFFLGRISEKGGDTRLSGVILTSPIYHLALIAFCIYFIVQSIILGGFTPLPLIFVLLTYFFYRSEYRKQGVIKRFIKRAVAYAESHGAGGDD